MTNKIYKHKHWTDEENNYLKLNYLVTKKLEIAAHLPKRAWTSIIQQAHKLEIGSRKAAGMGSGRIHFSNSDYFESIDTEEKAYWLGFIFADGSISSEGSIRISLVVEGKSHLEKFKKAIGYTGLVRGPYHVSSKKKGGEKTKYTLDHRNRKMATDLAALGAVPNKTFLIKFPPIAKELRRHFIRGLFDGDGSISQKITRYKQKEYIAPSFSICGGVATFLENVVKVFVEEIGVTTNKVLRSKLKEKQKIRFKSNIEYSAWRFSYQGTPALRIRDWMYDGATVWMECKKNKFYYYDYSMNRPQDKEHQKAIIDNLTAQRGWKRLSEYKGYENDMTFQCNEGHIYTTSVCMFKSDKGCPKCMAIATGKRNIKLGKDNITKAFAKRGWKLLSEYSSNGDILIECQHGKQFTRKRRTAARPSCQCDCDKALKLNFHDNW